MRCSVGSEGGHIECKDTHKNETYNSTSQNFEGTSLSPSENDWKEIAVMLKCLNEQTAPNHEDYLKRFRNNINALHVKLKDLEFGPLGTEHHDYMPLMQMVHAYYSKTVLKECHYSTLKKICSSFKIRGNVYFHS